MVRLRSRLRLGVVLDHRWLRLGLRSRLRLRRRRHRRRSGLWGRRDRHCGRRALVVADVPVGYRGADAGLVADRSCCIGASRDRHLDVLAGRDGAEVAVDGLRSNATRDAAAGIADRLRVQQLELARQNVTERDVRRVARTVVEHIHRVGDHVADGQARLVSRLDHADISRRRRLAVARRRVRARRAAAVVAGRLVGALGRRRVRARRRLAVVGRRLVGALRRRRCALAVGRDARRDRVWSGVVVVTAGDHQAGRAGRVARQRVREVPVATCWHRIAGLDGRTVGRVHHKVLRLCVGDRPRDVVVAGRLVARGLARAGRRGPSQRGCCERSHSSRGDDECRQEQSKAVFAHSSSFPSCTGAST